MSFFSLVRQFQLGQWHELVASHMTPNKSLCIPMLQADYYIPDIVMHHVVTDFMALDLCYVDRQDENYLCVNLDAILDILAKLKPVCNHVFTMQSLTASFEIPERQLYL